MRKRLIAVVATLALIVGLFVAGARYYVFVTQTIHSESTAHLTEIYHQVNQSLHSLVGRNWGAMRTWTPYLRDAKDDDKIDAYIEALQQENGFTDFYFISRRGEYQTAAGRHRIGAGGAASQRAGGPGAV